MDFSIFTTAEYYAFSAFINLITSTVFALLVLFQNRKAQLNQAFTVFAVSVAAWSFAYIFWQMSATADSALFWSRLLMAGAIFTAPAYLHFVLALLSQTHARRYLIYALYGFSFLFLVIDLLPPLAHLFVNHVETALFFPFWPKPGILFHPYLIFWSSCLLYAAFLLTRSFFKVIDAVLKRQVTFVFVAMIIAFTSGSTNYFLWYDIPVPPIANIAVSFYVLILGYAVLKHHLFSVKVIATELSVLALWIFILVRIFISENPNEQFINSGLLLLTIIVGIFLIKSVYREVEQRERIEKLAKELEKANERLKELDQLKSEFVSLATHQIRGPLTAMKGYASMLLQGDFGPVPENLHSPIDTIFKSSNSLTGIVQDFLDVSRIEQGRMKYEFTVFDLSKLVQSVGEELAPNIEGKGLRLKLEIEPRIMVYADSGKVRQVIENLIDNALKYTPQGSITVRLTRAGEKAILSVIDTGVGIAQETLPHLFKKFSRASDASKANIKGTGLGLYVAKQLIEAQHGTVRTESKGEDKGSTFTVELPLKT